jgi:hypothetical protein
MFGYFSTKGFKRYLTQAKRILDRNWTGSYTKPAPSLYPHQWNWDSGFVAIGYSHFNQKRAQKEILSLFDAQWPNGMLPQIVFNPDALGDYFPEPDFWQVPEGRLTSGITMPPMQAIACLHVIEHAKDHNEALAFAKKLFPRLMASHRYLYNYRDPEREGLVYIRHPWESGIDNSPNWDRPLKRIKIDKGKLPQYERKDLKHGVPLEERPSDDDYDRYVYLVDLFRKNRYSEEAIYQACPFLVQDILFNSILCRADQALLEIAGSLGEDTHEIREWTDQTKRSLSAKLWCEQCRVFDPYDLVGQEHIHGATAAGFMPLFSGAASADQAETLYGYMNSIHFCALHQGNCFTIPNFDMTHEAFDSRNYWRGPVWININWMLADGLKRYGYAAKADAMKRDIMQLPTRFGFHEYFDSISGNGHGSNAFSWTAALFLDILHHYYDKDKNLLSFLTFSASKKLKKTLVLNPKKPLEDKHDLNLAASLMKAMKTCQERFFDLDRGLVDYGKMKASKEYAAYKALTEQLHSFDLHSLTTHEEKLAFWINLYNTIVIDGIIELEIDTSVKEIPDFFEKIAYQIGPYRFSPDDMEHGILRGNTRPPYHPLRQFKREGPRSEFVVSPVDPRVHFALVCGSRSCAPIRFYEADQIEEQLELAAFNFINSSEVVLLPEEKKVIMSQIFDWYERDFGGKKAVLEFMIKYFDSDSKRAFVKENIDSIKIEYLFYDWNLNH